MLELSEESEDYFDTFKKNKRKHKDSDEEYNINEEEDLYSDIEEDEDASYLVSKTVKKKKPQSTIKKQSNFKTDKKIKPLRISFKNSLGGKNFKIKPKRDLINQNLNEIQNTNTKPKLPKGNKTLKNKNLLEEKRNFQNNLDKSYFYQNVTPSQWKEISEFLSKAVFMNDLRKEEITSFFERFPNLSKGKNNLDKLRQMLNEAFNGGGFFNFFSEKKFNFESYQKIYEYIIDKYYMPKPTVFEVHFFPNPTEEAYLINLISKTKTSLDLAMFTINNVHISEEIKNLYNRGINLRILTDSECIKMPSSNVYTLASLGIKVKIDDSSRYHMHHKFCVIDKSVVVTGSFNWTDQAVNHNQENLLFIENKELAFKYSNEFEKLWNDFEIVVTKEKALMKLKEDEEKKKAAESRKKREKEKKLIEQENMKRANEEFKYKRNDSFKFSKKKRRRQKENDENYDYSNLGQNKSSKCLIF